MRERERMVIVGFILILMIAFGSCIYTVSAQSTFPQPTGFAIISGDVAWEDQREVIRTAGATFVRLPITQGFGNHPGMIDELEADGITHIALAWQGCDMDFQKLKIDYQGRQYEAAVNANRNIRFYLEIGNEPDLFCPNQTPASYRDALLNIRKELRNLWSYPNLTYVAGLGATAEYSRQILADGRVLAEYDGLAYHIYAHGNFGDIPETFNYWKNELAVLGKPILLTEVGINGNIGKELKAQKYREFALQQPPSTEAIAFWTTAPDYKPQYYIDKAMAQVFAGVECFPETGHCISGHFAEFWHSNGLEFGDPGVSFRESLLLHGYPLTEPFIHPETGYLTQVFERSVLELHPENQPPYRVLMVHLGRQYLEECGGLCLR